MNGKNHYITWWWIIAYTMLVFLILLHQIVYEIFRIFSIQLCTRFGNVPNTTGVKHYRCCAITEILWSRSRLPEKSKFKKDVQVIAARWYFVKGRIKEINERIYACFWCQELGMDGWVHWVALREGNTEPVYDLIKIIPLTSLSIGQSFLSGFPKIERNKRN